MGLVAPFFLTRAADSSPPPIVVEEAVNSPPPLRVGNEEPVVAELPQSTPVQVAAPPPRAVAIRSDEGQGAEEFS